MHFSLHNFQEPMTYRLSVNVNNAKSSKWIKNRHVERLDHTKRHEGYLADVAQAAVAVSLEETPLSYSKLLVVDDFNKCWKPVHLALLIDVSSRIFSVLISFFFFSVFFYFLTLLAIFLTFCQVG